MRIKFGLIFLVCVALLQANSAKDTESKESDKSVESEKSTESTKTTESKDSIESYILPKTTIKASFIRNPLDSTTSKTFSLNSSPLYSGNLAQSLLNITGFTTATKGGGGSEAIFRSNVASRLPIYLDGGSLNGACGGRMDTTLTYIFPENYNEITILKGPQDVRYGALIGGGVLFDKHILRLDEEVFKANINALYGSYNRLDMNAQGLVGNKYGSLQVIASSYSSDDYKAANNETIRSRYNRESASIIGTLTPTQSTAISLSADFSDGMAAYADRSMDGRAFDRTSWNLKLEQKVNDTISLLSAQLWFNEVDHIMDNFTLRENETGSYSINNPKRTNTGGRIEATLHPIQDLKVYVGMNYNHDKHSIRQTSGNETTIDEANAILNDAYRSNFLFQNLGIFTQGEYLIDNSGVFFGVRYDNANTLRYASSDTAKAQKTYHLGSAFVRYEHYLDSITLFSGIGIAQRNADFWEARQENGMELNPETNTQLDVGITYAMGNFHLNTSLFASFVKDYIVLYYGDSTSAQYAQNIDGVMLGGEIESEYVLADMLHFYGSLAYTYGHSPTLKAPLPQIAPLLGRFSIFFEKYSWLLRMDLYFNAAQKRYSAGYGNVIGKDLGESSGFYTLGIYGGYTFKYFSLLGGVDNLTNTLYYYHLSKNSIADNPSNERVYEPGRSFWLKISTRF